MFLKAGLSVFNKVLCVIAPINVLFFLFLGDDTPSNTSRLALKAARPIRKDIIEVFSSKTTQ